MGSYPHIHRLVHPLPGPYPLLPPPDLDKEGRVDNQRDTPPNTHLTVQPIRATSQHTVGILDDGTVDNQCADSGTWEVGGSMVTRKWVDEDNDQRVDRSVDKEYYFANADIVFIHHWDSGDVETSFSRYVRVEDPLPTLLGIWRASIPQEEDEGTPWIDERTIAINADDLRWTGSGEECRPGARDRNSISIASTLSATGYWRTQLSACTKPTVSRVPVASA